MWDVGVYGESITKSYLQHLNLNCNCTIDIDDRFVKVVQQVLSNMYMSSMLSLSPWRIETPATSLK